jgi:hypothetical protein
VSFEKIKSFFNWSYPEALQSPYYWYALLLFLVLVLILWALSKMKQDLLPVFKDDEGVVQITPHALHELVKKTCEEMEGIFNPNTTIKKKGNAIRLAVQLRIQTDCNVQETRLELKRRLEEVMIKKLNFDNFDGVDILIKGFQTKK